MSIRVACTSCQKEYQVSDDKCGKKLRCKICNAVFKVPSRSSDTPEVSPGGSQMLRHNERTVPFDVTHGDAESIEAISNHIEEHIGPIEYVLHEIVSDLVHIDVHVVTPTDESPFYSLITSGMSDVPMTVPKGQKKFRFAELMIRLPHDWPMNRADLEDENNFWPIRLLKRLARLPHEYDTWLGFGHTVPNGDPAEPYASNTKLSCGLVLSMLNVPEGFHQLRISEDKVINFYGLYPLYPEETEFKLNKGTDELIRRFEKHNISEVVDPKRKNVCKRGWWPFG